MGGIGSNTLRGSGKFSEVVYKAVIMYSIVKQCLLDNKKQANIE